MTRLVTSGFEDTTAPDDASDREVPLVGPSVRVLPGKRISRDIVVQVIHGEDVFRLRELADRKGLAFWIAPMADPARIEHGVWYAITPGEDGEPRIDALADEP